MKITVTFDSYDEFMQWKGQASEQAEAYEQMSLPITAPVVPAVPPTPVTPAAPVTSAAPAPEAAPMTPIPTAAILYSLDDLARAGTEVVDAGKMEQLQAALAAFGVQTLPELNPDLYGAMATKLREMGARI